MALIGILMVTLFQLVVIYLLLLIVSFASKSLQPIIYAAIFFFFLSYVGITIIIPFGKTFMDLFEPLPGSYAKLLIGSVFLFYFSEMIVKHVAEAGYESIAEIATLAIKIAILSLWLPQLSMLLNTLSKFIIK
ncbi:SpoIIIAC/SpoIIIAD family protein [Saccharococcus sp. Marseille-Q5394]|uniref:SpoIIIAC/SpoIIIAD family protein n=1 Tax=Saccharococcus sp. Marseille-Q5394 TaxID=2972778 RepID=UPI0021C7D0FC|nr:SpoIIIAC/SpoIIIAD family protein [Saccharococcus sp. Marseille-Q5394]